jgi:E3 ubiquitin-protein ligase DOA10
MEREEELPSSSSSLGYMMQCRVCHEEEDQGRATMESPCGCSGSLKVHIVGFLRQFLIT